MLALICLLLTSLSAAGVFADEVIIESRQPSGALTPNPPYEEIGGWLDTSAKSAVPGLQAPGSRFVTGPDGRGLVLRPTLGVAGGTYRVEVTLYSGFLNVSTDIVASITTTGGTGLPANTDAFQAAGFETPNWKTIGTLQLDPGVTQPTIRFDYESGTVAGQLRWISDAFRFREVIPCLDTPEVSVVGPFNAGQTTVTVSGISTDPVATLVTVYRIENGVPTAIGTADPAGEASIEVPVEALIKGTEVGATQTVNDQEGCVPTEGVTVSGGPNPPILLAIGIRETATAGPVGADGGTVGTIEFVGASGLSGSAPQGKLIVPSNDWQTVTFNLPAEPVVTFTGDGVLAEGYGVLEHLAVSTVNCGGGQPGSYQFWVDTIQSGGATVADFDAFAAGDEVMFRHPGFSGSTSANLLSSPSVGTVDDTRADTASNSYRFEFQFVDESPQRWVRLTTFTAPNVPNPQVDLTQPLTLRILLPPESMTGDLAVTNPQDKTASDGDTVTFDVTALNANGDVHFQWYKDKFPIPNSDTASLSIPVTLDDNGAKIMVQACDDTKRVFSNEATLTVEVKPVPIGDVKNKVDGAQVELANPVVVSKSRFDHFWVQEQDRSSGIRVLSEQNPPENVLVTNVKGVLRVDEATGEKYIDATGNQVTVGAAAEAVPLHLRNDQISPDSGLPSLGLLVTVWGEVTGTDVGSAAIYIHDGSQVDNDTPTLFIPNEIPGLKVKGEAFVSATVGSYVKATGIARLEATEDEEVIPVLDLLTDFSVEILAP